MHTESLKVGYHNFYKRVAYQEFKHSRYEVVVVVVVFIYLDPLPTAWQFAKGLITQTL